MLKNNFRNGVAGLTIATTFMVGLITYNDFKEVVEEAKEEKIKYIYVECQHTDDNDVVIADERLSRGVEEGVIVEEEIVEEPVVEEETIVEEQPEVQPFSVTQEEVVVPEVVEPTIQAINTNFDILTPSNFTAEQLSSALQTYPHNNLLQFVDIFIEAEKTYGINALYLMSTIGWESGWGRYLSNTNNYAGWKDPSTGGFRYFNSPYECIMTVAEEVSTLWTQSVGSSLGNIAARYCPTPGYVDNIMLIMSERQNHILY